MCLCVRSLQSCLTLFNPINCSPPSPVHGVLQQEYWSGSPSPIPGDLPSTGIEPTSVCPAGGLALLLFVYHQQHLGSPFVQQKKTKFCLISGTKIDAVFRFPNSLLTVLKAAVSICGGKDWDHLWKTILV